MNRHKRLLLVNHIAFYLLLSLGALTLLFNILGLWAGWHLVGFAFFFLILPTIVLHIFVLFYSFKKDKRYKKISIIKLGISIAVIIFTLTVSATWFW